MRGRILAFGLLAMGCASELATSARSDDLAAFKRKLEAAQRASPPEPDSDQLREVAQVVASRELVTARGSGAESRVVEVAECATELEDALLVLSERKDAAGALATQVLIDSGRLDGELDEIAERHAVDKQDDWRAVGLRASVARADDKRRVSGFVDPDLRVRRAALRAAKDARAPSDLPHLFEAARLDPDRVSRRFALEAIGLFGGENELARLRELWSAGDETERLEITHVWGSDTGFVAGGERQLTWVLSSQTGLPRLSAAASLLRKRTPQVSAWAQEVLTTAIQSGSVEESRHALGVAPMTAKIVDATRAAARDKDEARAVGAAIALTHSKADVGTAIKRLRELRKSTDASVANAAAFGLASAGEPEAVKWADAQLKAEDPQRRLAAGLVALGRSSDAKASSKAATLLADPEPSVRVRFACWALREQLPKFDYFPSLAP